MMRGKKQLAVAVRDPKGQIVLHTEALPARVYDSRLTGLPLLRGLILLWDMLVVGTRMLMFSANVALSEEEDVELSNGAMYTMLLLSLGLGIGLFFVAPLLLVRFVTGAGHGAIGASLMEGVVRIAIFIGYLALMARVPDIRRTFMYHGAEHKTINAFEAGVALEPESVQRQSTIHPRCGTTLLLFVLVLAIFVFAAVGQPSLPVRILSRVVLVPLMAAVCYEWIRFAAKHLDNGLMRLVMKPAMALQQLTTRPPDLAQLEVSIAALQAVIRAEGLEPAAASAQPQASPSLSPQPT